MFVDTVHTKIKAGNAFNAMFVDTVETGVCGSYNSIAYAGVKTLHKVASCPCQEGRLLCEPSVLGVKLFTSQSEEAAL